MLKNRTLQVKMVKDAEKDTDVLVEVESFEEKATVVVGHLKNILLMIGGGVIAYVVADTYRQVAIEQAKK